MRISDWSSDVCSSDLRCHHWRRRSREHGEGRSRRQCHHFRSRRHRPQRASGREDGGRSEEHTSELQSLMRISYAVFCLKKKIHYVYDHITITLILHKSHDYNLLNTNTYTINH